MLTNQVKQNWVVLRRFTFFSFLFSLQNRAKSNVATSSISIFLQTSHKPATGARRSVKMDTVNMQSTTLGLYLPCQCNSIEPPRNSTHSTAAVPGSISSGIQGECTSCFPYTGRATPAGFLVNYRCSNRSDTRSPLLISQLMAYREQEVTQFSCYIRDVIPPCLYTHLSQDNVFENF